MPTTRTFIRSYGLFWSREEVNWRPGAGNRGAYRLLGRRNERLPALQLADFRAQQGIYVLYDDYGPYYVGLAAKQAIGNRLREHTRDQHQHSWDRFSWFGFRGVLKATEPDGIQTLGSMPKELLASTSNTIRDVEALLMMTLGTVALGNVQSAKFTNADRWWQVPLDETEKWISRIP